jgi:hypothetical protein
MYKMAKKTNNMKILLELQFSYLHYQVANQILSEYSIKLKNEENTFPGVTFH